MFDSDNESLIGTIPSEIGLLTSLGSLSMCKCLI